MIPDDLKQERGTLLTNDSMDGNKGDMVPWPFMTREGSPAPHPLSTGVPPTTIPILKLDSCWGTGIIQATHVAITCPFPTHLRPHPA